MTRLHIAHRLRALTETSPCCPAFTPPPNGAHGFCLRCGAEEWPHVARAAAELLEAAAEVAEASATSDRVREDDVEDVDVAAIDITNTQGVSLRGNLVVILFPRLGMTPNEALTHAAWLMTVAQGWTLRRFADVVRAVQGS